MSNKDNPKVKSEQFGDNGDTGNGNGKEEPKECPPGMKSVDGKCVPENGNGNSSHEQDHAPTQTDNAGDTKPVGTPTLTSASNKDNPANTHSCEDGFTCIHDGSFLVINVLLVIIDY